MMAVQIEPEADGREWLQQLLQGIFVIDDLTVGAPHGAALRARGRFLIDTERAYALLAPQVRARGRTLLFRREGEDQVILILNEVIRPTPNNRWLPVVLAILTVLSVLLTYTLLWEAPTLSWAGLLSGLPRGAIFTVSLLGILLSHELGHYFTARRYGVAVTLPFLIPFPLSPFGTMGAVIRMKDIPVNRRAMLRIGAAGPLVGLAVALPVLLVGLLLSTLTTLPEGNYILEGNSLLYIGLKYTVFGRLLPSGGIDVLLHPMALAGWAGILVTSLNLIPAGQLDGGHAAYALFGAKTRYLNWILIAAVLGLGLLWPGWFLWAVLIFIVSRGHPQPLDDLTPLRRRDLILGVVLLVLFALTFTPLPLRVV